MKKFGLRVEIVSFHGKRRVCYVYCVIWVLMVCQVSITLKLVIRHVDTIVKQRLTLRWRLWWIYRTYGEMFD